MRFCRNCGTVLTASSPGILPTPYLGGPPPPAMAPPGMGPPPGMMGPPPGMMGPPPGMMAPAMAPTPVPSGAGCPRCNAPVQPGFAFCQQCGFRIGAPAAPAPPPSIDAQGATLAAPSGEVARLRAMQPQAAPSYAAPPASSQPAPQQATWGHAVSVNRDGSDGERYPLTGDFVVFGRTGADISIEQDRFLARHHARLEATSDGAKITPVDTLNGVFRKLDRPIELPHGAIVLVGRELLRFERLDPDERNPPPLVRHGVALFGSPPREPWGRLSQLLPSGGMRDVRHLADDEVVIGREEGDLVFGDDAFLSRRHCTITWDGQRATLTDLGSSNGTFLRMTAPGTIRSGEHLRLGDQLFRIELRR